MLAFERQMKQLGFSGNQAQIVLGVEGDISESELSGRVHSLKKRFPILEAGIRRGILSRIPYWKPGSGRACSYSGVCSHYPEDERELCRIKRDILNRRLDIRQGELFRFDLVCRGGTDVEVILTWSHMLMDVHGAEFFLAMAGRSVPGEAEPALADLFSGGYTERMLPGPNWRQAKKSFQRVDELASRPPVSLYTRCGRRLAPRLDYRVISFSRARTQLIRDLAKQTGGMLNESAYFCAAAMGEFHKLMGAKNVLSSGYVVPVSVDLRKKGTRLPVFSNQSAVLLYGFDPEELGDFKAIQTSFTRQTHEAIRNEMIAANVSAMEFCRFIPSGLYARKMRQAFAGETASVVFANPGNVFERLSTFMGHPVKYQHHVPMIVVPPGMGIVFYTFDNRLHITLVFVESMITQDEAANFLGAVGRHLVSGRLP